MAGIIQKLVEATGKSADEIKKLLNVGSQTAPTLLKEADEALPTVAKNLQPEVVGPQVIGKGTSRAGDIAGDVIDAELVAPKVSTMDAVREFAKQNKGKIAGGLTLAELSRQMMGGEESPQIPLAAKSAPVSPVAQEADLAPAEPARTPGISPIEAEPSRAPGISPVEVEPSRAPAEEPDFVKMLQDAQEESKRNRLDASILRHSEQLGGGLARIAPSHESSKIALEQADQPTDDVKAKVGAHKEQQSYGKAQDEINDDKALNDPNSDISKTTAAQFAKYGINVKTAKEAKQLSPQIFNLLLQDRASANAKEVAKMGLEAAGAKQGKTLDEKQRKFAQGLRKEATTGVLGKQYATYSTGQRMSGSLAQFAENPSGYTDYATLMGGLKTLQGDESVVREAEMRLGINATSLMNKAYNYLEAARTGKSLQPSQRQEMISTIKILTDASRQQYMQSVAPILEQAEMEGIDPNMILSGSLAGAKEGKSSESKELTTSSGTRTFKSAQPPGSVVTVKSGKKYKIEQDGLTGTEIP